VSDSVYRTVRLGVVPTMYLPMSQGRFHGSAFSVTAKLASPRFLVERDIADAIGRAAPDVAFSFRDYSDQPIRSRGACSPDALAESFRTLAVISVTAVSNHGAMALTIGLLPTLTRPRDIAIIAN
jgi:hypothetical protein